MADSLESKGKDQASGAGAHCCMPDTSQIPCMSIPWCRQQACAPWATGVAHPAISAAVLCLMMSRYWKRCENVVQAAPPAPAPPRANGANGHAAPAARPSPVKLAPALPVVSVEELGFEALREYDRKWVAKHGGTTAAAASAQPPVRLSTPMHRG